MFWLRKSSNVDEGWGEVNVEDGLAADETRLEAGTAGEERDLKFVMSGILGR